MGLWWRRWVLRRSRGRGRRLRDSIEYGFEYVLIQRHLFCS
jgi:hypothetical protein